MSSGEVASPFVAETGSNGRSQECAERIVAPDDLILITGAGGFIGSQVVRSLLDLGFRNLRCFTRPTSDTTRLQGITRQWAGNARIELFQGNLLSRDDCARATRGVAVIFHLAAGRGVKSVPDAFLNSVVTTRNLLEAGARHGCLRRFVNVSSLAVYKNEARPWWKALDETCPVETRPELRCDAYDFAKLKQDEIVRDHATRLGVPYVIVRPGYVFGPQNPGISGRVGMFAFGVFLHLGGANRVPFTYVENCADAIALAGLAPGVDGEAFNVVDDDLPSSRQFLRLYKRAVRPFKSIYVPHAVSYTLCYLWERYSDWSKGQLPPAYNRKKWNVFWRRTRYSNKKLKTRVGWKPRVSMEEGLSRYMQSQTHGETHA
jgi:nucleoside-diphosphate-sugar epimerase